MGKRVPPHWKELSDREKIIMTFVIECKARGIDVVPEGFILACGATVNSILVSLCDDSWSQGHKEVQP